MFFSDGFDTHSSGKNECHAPLDAVCTQVLLTLAATFKSTCKGMFTQAGYPNGKFQI